MPTTNKVSLKTSRTKAAVLLVVIVALLALGLWLLNRDTAPSLLEDGGPPAPTPEELRLLENQAIEGE